MNEKANVLSCHVKVSLLMMMPALRASMFQALVVHGLTAMAI